MFVQVNTSLQPNMRPCKTAPQYEFQNHAIFTEMAPLGWFIPRFAMSVRVWLCGSVTGERRRSQGSKAVPNCFWGLSLALRIILFLMCRKKSFLLVRFLFFSNQLFNYYLVSSLSNICKLWTTGMRGKMLYI